MWVAWFLVHMPATIDLVPQAVSGPLLLLVAAIVLLVGAVRVPREDRIVVGTLGGLVAGLVTLLILGTRLTQQVTASDAAANASELRPQAGLMIVGFLVAMCVAGVVAGFGAVSLGGRATRPRRTPASWLASFAVVNAVAILPLLTLGGLVTSARAGFAVPDWPGTYGANMFLYPIGLMSEPRIFLEHTHRLFGAMVGLTTAVGFIFALCCAPKGWMKLAAFGLLLLVIVQGIAGGLWTQEKAKVLVIAHGVVGQVYFALTLAYATALSSAWARWNADRAARAANPTPSIGIAILLVLLLIQLVMGTMTRHLGSAGKHALFTHMGLSMIILVMAIILGTKMMRLKSVPEHGKGLKSSGHHLTMAVGLQFLLGWVALIAWMSDKDAIAPVADQLAQATATKPWIVLTRTVHQANGALVLGTSAVMAVWGLLRPRASM
jgi:cytochrome c oxidase assembly protein subunit 15